MHDCQRYREDWVAGVAEELVGCDDCRSFCQDASAILQATSAAAPPSPEFSNEYWNSFESRMRKNLVHENAVRRSYAYVKWGSIAGAAAVVAVVVTWGGANFKQSTATQPVAQREESIQFNEDHIQGLNPMVVVFLSQSEMFLRTFTKIQPEDTQDIVDARDRAKQTLLEATENRELAARFAPVRIALEEYEGVLRDIKNLKSPEDLTDIQSRIQRNGLIANLKAYQPRISLVSQR